MAKYNQGDVVFLRPDKFNVDLPNIEKNHPVLIISNHATNLKENYYTAVMVTHNSGKDGHSFLFEQHMFEGRQKADTVQARLHITVSFKEEDVSTFVNKLKRPFLINLLKNFACYTLGI